MSEPEIIISLKLNHEFGKSLNFVPANNSDPKVVAGHQTKSYHNCHTDSVLAWADKTTGGKRASAQTDLQNN